MHFQVLPIPPVKVLISLFFALFLLSAPLSLATIGLGSFVICDASYKTVPFCKLAPRSRLKISYSNSKSKLFIFRGAGCGVSVFLFAHAPPVIWHYFTNKWL